jgi:hypothetical protein
MLTQVFEMTEQTKSILAGIQIENICKLLDGEVKYYHCSDLHSEHKKIEIIYDKKKRGDSLGNV